ncbi:peptide ABC transporter substrate-binding protein [Camelliibacillus cellulosilyticus]|uniref:Peptide ABC transporter substrate-binding protein n=1 Tax=Camelliibacillus cellulosilyticus TaxID=2174486 RepID=A0ABV9GM63_9BACL
MGKGTLMMSLLLVFALVLSACASGASQGTTGKSDSQKTNELADKQVLNLTDSDDIPTLDITHATDTSSFQEIYMLESGLMTVYSNKTEPDLAAGNPKVSKDGKTYTFTIRDDAKWSDGSPVTANDFVFSWHHMVDPKSGAEYAYIYGSANIKNAAQIMDKNSDLYGKVDQLGIKALDEKTLQITLDKPTPYFLSLMSFPPFFPIKEDFYKQQGDQYALEPNKLLYNGPYVMKQWSHGSGWTLVKNEKYWDAKHITIDQVNYKVVKDVGTKVNLYNTDKIDVTGLVDQFVNQYKNSSEFTSTPGNCVFYLSLNFKKVPAFKNKKLRQAMAMSIDRDSLVNVLLNDGSVPAHFIVPKNFTKGPDGKDFRAAAPKGYLLGSKQEAKKLWDEAKKELGIHSLKIEYLTTDTPHSQKMGEYVADQIEKNLPGLKITINKQPWGNYLKLGKEGNYNIGGGSGWCPDYQDPMTFLDMWTSDQNDGGWSNQTYDNLIKQAANEGNDPAKRWKTLQEAEKVLVTEAPVIPTYQNGSARLVKSFVKGLDFPSYGPDTDYRHAKVYKH